MCMCRKELAEQKRKEILEVARELFLSQGYQATSTRAIAEKCGITQPNLYHHFKNKQVLFREVIEDLIQEVEIAQRKIVAKGKPADETIVEMMVAIIKIHPSNFFSMIGDFTMITEDQNQGEFYAMYQRAYVAPFVEVFETCDLREGVSTKDAATHLLYHLGAVMSVTHHYQKQETVERLTRTVDFLLNGLVK